ncbi:hypothetical protein POTOM_039174 [Populus tomentosa]|uniref:Pectate lyase n=1 Tax=Populus tomentosa TaxID=118781 RepID=A0A8X8CJA1_POPTO|nr:hypothetical protein POTOM_039174 [Populus tomentosa]
MASLAYVLLLSFLATLNASTLQDDSLKYKPKPLSSYLPSNYKKVLNTIDSCWRTDCNRRETWENIYVVSTPDDDPTDSKPGTLQYGAIQTEPLWITFDKDMVIKLENELMINSFKTIDGRGSNVEITDGPCLKIEGVSHVITHGISIHDCKPGKRGFVRNSPTHVGQCRGADGDAISIFASSNIWIDHFYLVVASMA